MPSIEPKTPRSDQPTFDTSALIRAFTRPGPAALLMGYAKAGDFRLDTSEAIVKEMGGVLREKFKLDGYSIFDSIQKLKALANMVTPSASLSVIKEDPDDDRILECAKAAQSDYIVSEDKDLLRLGAFEGSPVVSITRFFEIVVTGSTLKPDDGE